MGRELLVEKMSLFGARSAINFDWRSFLFTFILYDPILGILETRDNLINCECFYLSLTNEMRLIIVTTETFTCSYLFLLRLYFAPLSPFFSFWRFVTDYTKKSPVAHWSLISSRSWYEQNSNIISCPLVFIHSDVIWETIFKLVSKYPSVEVKRKRRICRRW